MVRIDERIVSMDYSKSELVADVCEVIALPQVCMQIVSMVDDPFCTIDDIANAITYDISLTVKLLKIANSPAYGFSGRIATVHEAVKTIGTSLIRDLVFATEMITSFSKLDIDIVTLKDYWRKCVYQAVAAKIIGEHVRATDAQRLFVCGLLLDLGELIIMNQLPEESKTIKNAYNINPELIQIHLAEKKFLGFDHTEVGSLLAENWHFPDCIVSCIRNHHHIERETKYTKEVAIANIADYLARLSCSHRDVCEILSISQQALDVISLTEKDILGLLDEIDMMHNDAIKVFLSDDFLNYKSA